jgi:hypothetical protein
MIIETVGWVLVITGQSVVLYSRLHLIVTDVKILRAVLIMIILNGLIWVSDTLEQHGSRLTTA